MAENKCIVVIKTVDRLEIWGYALSADEVTALWTTGQLSINEEYVLEVL